MFPDPNPLDDFFWDMPGGVLCMGKEAPAAPQDHSTCAGPMRPCMSALMCSSLPLRTAAEPCGTNNGQHVKHHATDHQQLLAELFTQVFKLDSSDCNFYLNQAL